MSLSIVDPPASVPGLSDCFFYHTMDVPGYGLRRGQWDLRAGVDDYLGHVDLADTRVLELGPASGFLTFEMERRGAHVTACELPTLEEWDLVPYASFNPKAYLEDRKELGRRLRNAFWVAHAGFESGARLAEGSVYDLTGGIGSFDTAVFGMILLHLRDPFRALENAVAETTKTVIVTEIVSEEQISESLGELDDLRPSRTDVLGAASSRLSAFLSDKLSDASPSMYFCPRASRGEPLDTWWQLTPAIIQEFLGVLGFEEQEVRYHWQLHDPKHRWVTTPQNREAVYFPCFTVVARRA
jgi:SAM-dependent methyltransferase